MDSFLSSYLADVNFILAILHPEHPHSLTANAWLAEISVAGSIGICRVAQMGAIRLLTKNLVMGDAILSGRDAWQYVKRLFDDERIIFVSEPSNFEQVWETICSWTPQGSSAETDAYLAAFAIALKVTIVTFDKGLTRFPDLKVVVPK